jgi:RHH-type proline utilization regulon transcriptional repressor/proline dehydrogenase/delta 1-pyrroline-5-carboxylate dehydrogenase
MSLTLSRGAFAPEPDLVRTLLEAAEPFGPLTPRIRQRAHGMVERLRRDGLGFSVEAFLQEYGLSTKEGVAVMCLAEALLRIPDAATADELIESTFSGAEWEKHLGRSDSLFVNASSWGLVLTGKTLDLVAETQGGVSGVIGRLAKKLGEPVIREALKAAMKMMAGQFVLGETIEEGIRRGEAYAKKGYRFSYDMLGEGARSQAQAETYLAAYHAAIEAVGTAHQTPPPVGGRTGGGRKSRLAYPYAPTLTLPLLGRGLYEAPSISIKLTALHPHYEWRHREQVFAELLPKLVGLAKAAQAHGLCIAIDAEEQTRFDLALAVYEKLVTHPDLADYHGIGYVLQAYGKRAHAAIPVLADLATRTKKRLPVRLVKGAYWDSEIKAAQVNGWPDYPVFTRKAHSDLSYLACARALLERPECFFPQFATHNAMTIAAIEAFAGEREYEFQRLHGMGEALYADVITTKPCRIYAPIGEHKDLLAYLIRRLLENGANSSFVHMMLDLARPIDAVLEDPLEMSAREPEAGIAPPSQLYGTDRRNSAGLDFGNAHQMEGLEQSLRAWQAKYPPAPKDFTADDTDAAITRAQAAFTEWSQTPVDARAALLEKAADLLEARREEAMALIIGEGRRTWADALSEVREAVDFCRYYASRGRELFGQPRRLDGPTGEHNELRFAGRGVFGCISPWNFPLAIFAGQVVAALVSGNTVIAKPAEQTPRTAAFMVALLHEAGVPPDALILVPGAGEVVGAALARDERIAGIAFTGGTATAKHIQRALAQREGPIVPLIAETGGQNAMIVDSSALIEQAVDDILTSAFGSAGQRCSALRVLCVHRDIADNLLGLLAGAMQVLEIGDPWHASTDLGPVIDGEAKAALEKHVAFLEGKAKRLAIAPLTPTLSPWGRGGKEKPSPLRGQGGDRREPGEGACFFPPQAWEIPSLDLLRDEIFGPVLHIYRYDPAQFDAMLDALQATGYGLTFGIHSRIPSVYESVAARVKVGNCYVNRSMIGATVGVQPFGGEGLSGTGPKAGGPYYLLRFATERTLTINTAAIGGNIELLVK